MRIISKKALREFSESHPDAKDPLLAWYRIMKKGTWVASAGLKDELPNVRILGDDRAVFNIKGNKYRLVVKIKYQYGVVYIRFVGTHAEYDRINPREV